MSILAVTMTISLISIALAISRQQKLELEGDLLVGALRAVIQLMTIGYILKFVFDSDSSFYIIIMVTVMIFVASHNTAKKGGSIPKVFQIVTFSITIGTVITLVLLLSLKIVDFVPRHVIPISGMIVGNAMVAGAIALNNLKKEFRFRKGEILAALSLGATARRASQLVINSSIKSGMIPTIEGMKTIGLVQLPGMMTGAILAGADPLLAVRFQIMVVFMLTSSVSISCFLISLLAYKQFFTKAHQLNLDLIAKD